MNISDLPKPALFNLLLQIEPSEIRIVCNSENSKVREICYLPRFIEEYKNKYGEGKLSGFSKPVLLQSDLINFLLKADFGKYNSQIHEVIDPLIKRGIFNRTGLTFLFGIYNIINNLLLFEEEKIFYTTDELMNKYLDQYLREMKNRDKFSYFKLASLSNKGVIPSSEYSLFDKITLNSRDIQNSVENAVNLLREIIQEVRRG